MIETAPTSLTCSTPGGLFRHAPVLLSTFHFYVLAASDYRSRRVFQSRYRTTNHTSRKRCMRLASTNHSCFTLVLYISFFLVIHAIFVLFMSPPVYFLQVICHCYVLLYLCLFTSKINNTINIYQQWPLIDNYNGSIYRIR